METLILFSLCNLCVLCVSVVIYSQRLFNHRDTEHTEVAQRRKTLVLLALLICIGVFRSPAVAQDEFKPKTVFLIRHAEKEDGEDPPLNRKGVARSQELARLLANSGIKAILTSQARRTRQTAAPIANKLGLTPIAIDLRSNPANPQQIAEASITEVVNKILERSGENVLVVGHTNSIPDVIKMLGGDVVPRIDERKFNDLFIVIVYAKGKAKVTQMKYGAE